MFKNHLSITNNSVAVLLSFGILLVSGCQRKAMDLGSIKAILIDSTSYVELNIPDSSKFDPQSSIDSNSLVLIPLEQTEKSIFSEITRLFVVDSSIVIFDRTLESVIIYDFKGKFVSRIDVGEDILKIFDVTVDYKNKNILVYDENGMKMLRYNTNGQKIEKVPIDFFIFSFSAIPFSDHLVYNAIDEYNSQVSNKFKESIIFTGKNGNIDSYVPNLKKIQILSGNYLPRETLFSSVNYLYFIPPHSRDIYSIGKGLSLKYRIKFPGKDINDHIKGVDSKKMIDMLNTNQFYSFSGPVFQANNMFYLAVNKDELRGYFFDINSRKMNGGKISYTVQYNEKEILPAFNYPISSTGEKFISILKPPYDLNAKYIDKTDKVIRQNPNSLIICMYNVKPIN